MTDEAALGKLLLAMVVVALPSILASCKTDWPALASLYKNWQFMFYAIFFLIIFGLIKC